MGEHLALQCRASFSLEELSNQLAEMGSKLLQSFEMQSVLAQLQKAATQPNLAGLDANWSTWLITQFEWIWPEQFF